MRAYDEAMAGKRTGRPAFSLGDLEPQACYVTRAPAFLGVLERLDDDWPRFLRTFAAECELIGGCARFLEKRHDSKLLRVPQVPLDAADEALARLSFAHDFRLHAAATDLSLIEARWPGEAERATLGSAVDAILDDFAASGRRDATCFAGPAPAKVVLGPDGDRVEAVLDGGWRRQIERERALDSTVAPRGRGRLGDVT